MSGARRRPGAPLAPVLLKTEAELDWPEHEPMFYLLGRDGLFRCRNSEFFRSCVPASDGPSELAEQAPFLNSRFPRIPRELFEQTVGFFDRVADRHGCEAAVLLVWDRTQRRVRLVVPEQTATVSVAWDGYRSPIGVYYVPPVDLPADWVTFGDIHSHVHHSAYASSIDKRDEAHSAGLHVVVGCIDREPPQLHVEAVVDGMRFELDAAEVIEDYQRRRRQVPQQWIGRVRVEVTKSSWRPSGRFS